MQSFTRRAKKRILKVLNGACWPWYLARYDATIRKGEVPSDELLKSLVYHWGNSGWSADHRYLKRLIEETLNSNGKLVLECGSGLSTLLLGKICDLRSHKLFALEHHRDWESRMNKALQRARVRNAIVCHCPIKNYGDFDWYDISGCRSNLEKGIDLVICDGPPGNTRGGRTGLPYVLDSNFRPGCLVLADDAHRPAEQSMIEQWLADFSCRVDEARSDANFKALIFQISPEKVDETQAVRP